MAEHSPSDTSMTSPEAAAPVQSHVLERSPQEIAQLATASRETPDGQSMELNELQSQNPLPDISTSSNEPVAMASADSPTTRDPPTTITSASRAQSNTDSIGKPLSPPLTREETVPALGPAIDKPIILPPTPGHQLLINLQLLSGARHPYNITEKYLAKRNVNVPDNNPVNMSVYTLKELIWRDWREEWDPRPAAPTSIRLIHFGKLLDDKAYLKDGRFTPGHTPHVVHMTVKPQDIVDEEDARIAKGGSRGADGEARGVRCRCTVM